MRLRFPSIFNEFCVITGLLTIFLLVMPAYTFARDAIIMGVHPYLPREILIRRFTPLTAYLSQQLGIPVKLQISKNYESHIENLGNNIFDFAYMGPASYVELTNKYGKHRLLARLEVKGKPYFNGYIITSKNSKLTKLSDLKGKKFAFGSPHSTMSYLVPRYMLKKAGVELNTLSEYKFLGNHRNVAIGVLIGEFDAGAVKEEVYFSFMKRGARKIAVSPAISEHLFVCKKGISDNIHQQIRHSLLTLSTTDSGKQILNTLKKGITGLVPVQDRDYDILRKILQ